MNPDALTLSLCNLLRAPLAAEVVSSGAIMICTPYTANTAKAQMVPSCRHCRTCYNLNGLEHRQLESRKRPSPTINRLIIVGAVESRAPSMSQRSSWPFAKHLRLPLESPRGNSRVQSVWLLTLLHPTHHNIHVALRIWPRLQLVTSVVRCSRDEVKMVPNVERL